MKNEEKKEVGTEVTTKNSVADNAIEIKKKTLDELLAEDKELQSQYDTKVTNSLKTAKNNWKKELKAKKEKAEKLKKKSKKQKEIIQLQVIVGIEKYNGE